MQRNHIHVVSGKQAQAVISAHITDCTWLQWGGREHVVDTGAHLECNYSNCCQSFGRWRRSASAMKTGSSSACLFPAALLPRLSAEGGVPFIELMKAEAGTKVCTSSRDRPKSQSKGEREMAQQQQGGGPTVLPMENWVLAATVECSCTDTILGNIWSITCYHAAPAEWCLQVAQPAGFIWVLQRTLIFRLITLLYPDR